MAPITPLMRMVAQRRTLSIFTRARAVVRTFEPHPFERLPITQKAAKADWGKQIRHVGDAAMFYFPAFGILLGWPLLAERVLDGHIGDY